MKKIFYIVIFVSPIGLFFFSTICIVCFFINLGRKESSSMFESSTEYQYFQHNPDNNESSVGFATLFQDLEENEFISYEEENNHILISNVGSEEYICTGLCVCEEYRRLTSTISRSVLTLVAAMSSIIAYSKAREYFERDCVKKLSDSCSVSSVKVEVDDCEKSDYIDWENPPKLDEDSFRYYACQGHCQPKTFKRKLPNEMSRNAKCWKFATEGEVKIDVRSEGRTTISPQWKFQEEIMIPYCKKSAPSGRYFFTKGRSRTKNWVEFQKCHGGSGRGSGLNKTIKCRRSIPGLKKRY